MFLALLQFNNVRVRTHYTVLSSHQIYQIMDDKVEQVECGNSSDINN